MKEKVLGPGPLTKVCFSVFFVLCFLQSYGQQRIIRGVVTDGINPLPDVNISLVGEESSVVSGADGTYSINANTADLIRFSRQGLKKMDIVVEDVTRYLNITMVPDVQELEEVTVVGSNRKSQQDLQREYATNKNLIKTAYGILNADTAPGNIRFLYENEINDVTICILDLVRNQFPGMRTVGNCSQGGSIFIRGIGSVQNPRSAIYDVDGMIFTDTPLWIIPSTIHRIAVLGSLNLTTTYGSLGAGGVIVINTKVAGTQKDPDTGKPYDFAKLRNNVYQNDAVTSESLAKDRPAYIKELQEAKSLEEAKSAYQRMEMVYGNSFHFALDAYTFFVDKWDDFDYADQIISENTQLFESNPLALKALAYSYESQERYEKANETYKEVFVLRPNYAQSYRDLAQSSLNLNDPRRAAGLHARYYHLITRGFIRARDSGFTKIIDREFQNVLLRNGKELDQKNSNIKKMSAEAFKGVRLVFEWNDSEAEFELELVNPENHYYLWKHSLAGSPERIMDEKLKGYSCQEYLIDDSMRGIWKVNVKYLGNKSLTPTYLKATIYQNYNTRDQSKETKVFKLRIKNLKQQLFTLSNAGTKITY
ncbi:tetratricopeptide repeat protein [Poritiphilus flavus]|uniref:Uncharacterized protein n=1 Tax=Poritiphilus flavus TaxID=2697053 RepID=A0A6L9EFD3_9FLAO|nr:tetratricopeptide repeat protein [Poritiphilus flavus]NAS13457.1 hypothetical protein [Poritiphilus flavus]